MEELIPCPDGSLADAAVGCVSVPANVVNPESSLLGIILKLADYLSLGVGSIAILFLIFGAIRYATAAGNDDKISQAKKIMFWSVFGLILSLAAKSVVGVILETVR